ncbi:23S rRNA pseudouridine(1911/1915/1917) synthase RluD [Allochromatium humboldtianum]|uniref:Pseudouridine synthase n=1 Tax=Allochromatium humboldtianum TaxID=504901 RepID=A0A850R539_9GAMM|nr:23S rRNA pseudouridine(1911/1915/1917) synthase RluD [Allochromatium humboldtianum]NVZ07905.1 23S rRNA pseudouridine(1911/1915/1917) synthase RluD [Allochromatium humboldtianum]
MKPFSTETIRRSLRVESDLAGGRLDRVLAQLLPEFSRGRLQQWIEAGQVLVDDRPCRVRDKVWGGESIRIEAELAVVDEHRPQAIALDLVYEDEHLLVIDKPAGLVVHPAAGNPDGTLLNALLHHAPELATLPRAGIVHRLDKDTTGLMVVARTLQAHCALVEQLQRRIVHREYRALVLGTLVAGGRVEAPIGRHPTQRVKMAVVGNGREAITHYRVLESYPGHTLLAVELETGRTHQIRVHMTHIHHPLVGDTTYGARPRPPRGCHPELAAALQSFPRQALHAIRLGLIHPATGAEMQWEVPMAPDLDALLELFRREVADGADRA